MTIYIRTAAGNDAALNATSPLPRKLRTLLIAIDGRTRVDTYVRSLSSFGDVEALLDSLQDAGLIETVHLSRTATTGKPDDQTSGGQSDAWSDTDASQPAFEETSVASAGAFARLGNAFRRTDSPASAFVPVSVPGPDAMSSWAEFQQTAAPSAPRQAAAMAYYASSSAGGSANTAQYQLRNAVSLMSDFVTQHLSADSLEIVLMLEGLGSVEQVLASLKGYESLVAPVGEPARRHLTELRTVLARF